jgi:uncharacterized protein YbdZ (MbtH family)
MKLKHYLIYTAVCLIGCSTSGTSPTISSSASLAHRPPGDTAWVCAYQVPPGWVVIDMRTNYGQCGGGMNNVWEIENLNGMPINSIVSCCSGTTLPSGWVVTGYSTNYGRCGGNAQNNIETIRKLSRRHR